MTGRIVADDPAGRAEAVAILAGGGLVAIPTDTVYGLAVSRTDPAAVDRLMEVKGRPPEKGIAILLADPAQADEIAILTPPARILAAALWPGGLTLVVPARSGTGTAESILGPGATLGLRVPDHPCPRAIAAAIGPLPASSANRSGAPECPDAASVAAVFGMAIDLVVDGGPAVGGRPSTVVDCTEPEPRILRVGAIPEERIAAVLVAGGVGR